MSAYFPSGTTGDERQEVKMNYLDFFFDYIHDLQKTRSKILVCGDYNICHREIDIHNPVSNKDASGFKPEERAWMEKYFNSGFIDTFRFFHPQQAHEYSWWSFRANSGPITKAVPLKSSSLWLSINTAFRVYTKTCGSSILPL
ncbi:MAG: hypothetical protein IPH78_09165 [Bacteroidetes bacterium]|nr:hypothetical protein [Bacteroidota bacterium]